MVAINFPEPAFRMKQENSREYIFDPLRKKWLLLTPEEWVRQNFIQYLSQVKRYPSSLIALEKEIRLGELRKRFDILIYNKNHQPWMMVECKASEVKLDEAVLQQVLRYNIGVPVEYIIITNGHFTYGWQRTEGSFVALDAIPSFVP